MMKYLITCWCFIFSLLSISLSAQTIKMTVDGYSISALDQAVIIWQNQFKQQHFPFRMNKENIYLGNRIGELVALNRQTGRELWRKKISQGWVYSPVIYKNLLITGGQAGVLYGFDSITQKLRWQKDLQQELVYQPVSNGKVLIATTFDGKVHAFSIYNGQLLWTKHFSSASQFPVFYKNQVILASYDGTLRFLSLKNGTLTRQENVHTFLLFSPKINHNRLLLINNDQQQYTFNL